MDQIKLELLVDKVRNSELNAIYPAQPLQKVIASISGNFKMKLMRKKGIWHCFSSKPMFSLEFHLDLPQKQIT